MALFAEGGIRPGVYAGFVLVVTHIFLRDIAKNARFFDP